MKTGLFLLFLVAVASPISAKEGAPTSQELVRSREMWDGTPLPAYPTAPAQVSVVKFVIPVGAELPWHKHPSINAGYVISGTLTVIGEDGKQKTLKAGEALVEMVNKWHRGRNDGDVPVEIVVFYAGAPGVPLAIKKE